jgi:deoxyribonuclease-4
MYRTIKERVGVQIRLQESVVQLFDRAEMLDISLFQCFLVRRESGTLARVTDQEVALFVQKKRSNNYTSICHGSYLINLASLGNNGYYFLHHEVALAKRLEFAHFLLHCGTAHSADNKSQGIDALAFCLNKLIKNEPDISIVLENTAHGRLSVGSDITDFKHLLEKIDKPERINFCIDTAHAHSYGYAIIDEHDQDQFISLLDNTIGLEKIILLHLNDSYEMRGSKHDRHAAIGQGYIGLDALKSFALHRQLSHIPFILEMPEMSVDEEKMVIDGILGWNN